MVGRADHDRVEIAAVEDAAEVGCRHGLGKQVADGRQEPLIDIAHRDDVLLLKRGEVRQPLGAEAEKGQVELFAGRASTGHRGSRWDGCSGRKESDEASAGKQERHSLAA
jgi:hypothetical protein